MERTIRTVMAGFVCVLISAASAFCQEEPVKPAEPEQPETSVAAVPAAPVNEGQVPEKPRIEIREIEGQITGLSGNFMAIVYGQSDISTAELAFNLDKSVQVVHKRSLKELKVGDTVRAKYEQETRKLEDGRMFRKNTIKSITFLKAAPKDLFPKEEDPSPSKESASADEPLTLKGPKGR